LLVLSFVLFFEVVSLIASLSCFDLTFSTESFAFLYSSLNRSKLFWKLLHRQQLHPSHLLTFAVIINGGALLFVSSAPNFLHLFFKLFIGGMRCLPESKKPIHKNNLEF